MNNAAMTGLAVALLRIAIVLPLLLLAYTFVALQPHIVLGQWLGLTSLDWSLLNVWVSVGFGLVGVVVLFSAFRRVDRDSPLQGGIVITAWAAVMLGAPVVDLTGFSSGTPVTSVLLPAWLGRYLETIGGILLRGNRIAEDYWPLASLAALAGLSLVCGVVLIVLGVLN